MKATIKYLLIAMAMIFTTSAMAQTQCHIILGDKKPCKHRVGVTPGTPFVDGDALANVSPKRCAQRAKEYYRWCEFGPYQNWVGSYFMNKEYYNAATTTDGVQEYFFNANGDLRLIHIGTGKVEK